MATQEQLQAIRSYAQSLNGDERANFISKFESIKGDDNKVSTLASRIGARLESESSSNKSSGIGGVLAGTGALAGVGVALDQLYGKPTRALWKADRGLREIGNQFGIDPKTSPGFVPRGLNDQIQSLRTSGQAELKNIKAQSTTSIKDIQRQISGLDAGDIAKESNNLANIIKSKSSDTYKAVMDNFGKNLDAIDDVVDKSGFRITNKMLVSNFIDPVIEEAKASGISNKEIGQLMDIKQSLMEQSKIVDAKGKPIETKIQLSKAKEIISNITKESPYSPLSAKVRENWAKFLESEAPKEIKPMYEKLNKQYKPFTEARAFLTKLSDPKTGEFDTARLSKYISDYAKKGSDEGISKLMKFVGEGNELMPKVEGVSDSFGNIKKMGKARKILSDTLKNINSQKDIKINAVDQKNIGKVKTLLDAKAKANALLDIAKENRARLTARNPLNIPGKLLQGTLGVGKGIIRGLPSGVVESETMKRSLGIDPVEAFSIWRRSQFGGKQDKQKLLQELEKRALDALAI